MAFSNRVRIYTSEQKGRDAMLTLTRKVGEKIVVGSDIEIVVREIRGKQVRLSIKAPKTLRILRDNLTLKSEELCRSQVA